MSEPAATSRQIPALDPSNRGGGTARSSGHPGAAGNVQDTDEPGMAGAVPGKDVPCAYCDTSVVGSAFLLCASCEVPVHRDCWAESGTCPTYACGATRALDPALAIFRRERAPARIDGLTAPAATASSGPAAPTSRSPSKPDVPDAPSSGAPGSAPRGDWIDRLFALGGMLGKENRFAAVSIEMNVGSIRPGSWLRAFRGMFGRRRPTDHPAVRRLRSQAMDPAAEADLIERELELLRHRKWVRKMGLIAGALLLPVVLKLVSKLLLFPMIVALAGWSSWPGWVHRSDPRRERALQARLDQLALLGIEPEHC